MAASDFSDARRPTLFALHYLGGSSREWSDVAARVRDVVDVVALDLPGFGDAAQTSGYSVDAMARTVARAIRAASPGRFLIAGHSMGAKVAIAIARAAEDGATDLAGLIGLVSVAGSPPAPEPIPDDDRNAMLGWFRGTEAQSRDQAVGYVTKNSGSRLDPVATERAVTDVLRANVDAWRAWLEHGSREDWAERVGTLRTPLLLVAGADDENLGPDTQARLTATHFRDVRMVTIPAAKHLLPLEAPAELALAIRLYVAALSDAAPRPVSAQAYGELIASKRVSSGTRRALLERASLDDPSYAPTAVDARGLATLRALVDRIVPQSGHTRIDFAARIDRGLTDGIGDGWRFDRLPTDAAAYRLGLATLAAESSARYARTFVELDDAERDAILAAIADGSLRMTNDALSPDHLTAEQMRSWFEDVRAEVVRQYVAHPDTLARLGYSGFANGGDGFPKSGFVRVGVGEREAWEPVAASEVSR